MNHPARILVVGGGYAGVLAAQRVARRAGARAQVTLVNPAPEFVERIRLHQVAAGWTPRTRPIAELLHGTGASLRLARALQIDVAGRRVRLDEDGVRSWVDIDHLVLAAGSSTRLAVPGGDRAFRLDTPASARELGDAARRAASEGRRLVIVGGGLTAIEAATELTDAVPDLRVAMICRGAIGEGALGAAAVAHVRAALARRDVEMIEDATVLAIEPGAVVTTGGLVHSGPVVWAAGFVASPLAAAAGLDVDGAGRMQVGETLAARAAPWIWGAGDAAVPDVPVGGPMVMSCKTAMPMAAHVADSIDAVLRDRPPRGFSFGDSLVCVSLGRGDAVIQLRDRAGAARGVVRRRAAAWIKEGICRFTLASLHATRRWAGFYTWLGGPRQLPAAAHPQLGEGRLP